jgi:hypothetical protein
MTAPVVPPVFCRKAQMPVLPLTLVHAMCSPLLYHRLAKGEIEELAQLLAYYSSGVSCRII